MDLASKIRYYAEKYYEGNPEISDFAFDKLVEQLEAEDPKNPILSEVGWGYTVNCDPDKELAHRFPVAKFEDKVKSASSIPGNPDISVVTPKLDGGSICCYYINGKLDYAITRGNGITGFDVTDKLKYLVPVDLIDSTFTGLVRGEITMTNETFRNKYSDRYTSNRNLCVGNMRRKSISVPEIKDMDFVAYTVRGTSSYFDLNDKSLVLKWIDDNNFVCVDSLDYSHDNWDDDYLRDLIKSYIKYPVDGVVITSDKYQDIVGTEVPCYEVAYKTEAEGALVKVTDIHWQFSSTGRLNPVVEFKPVLLSGAWVHRATAFNHMYINNTGLGVGSEIIVNRSGEVIPDIQDVITKGDSMIPKVCPKCGGPLEVSGAYLICNNPDCSGKLYNDLVSWVNHIAPVKGIGWTIINGIFEDLGISSVDDLYEKIDLINRDLPLGPATLDKVMTMKAKLTMPVDIATFIMSCNIKGCGWTQAIKLGEHYNLLLVDPYNNANWESQINGLSRVNRTVKANLIKSIDKIRRYAEYISVTPIEEDTKDENEEQVIIAVTGKLSVTRSKFFEEVSEYGYKEGTINKAKYLVTDNPNSGSSKNKKARDLGIEVISENDFRKMLA